MQDIGRNRQGFTLIELLIGVAIIAIISLTIFSAFANGIKIWQRINSPLPREDLAIFLSKFKHDLQNSFKFTGISFKGEERSLTFPSLVGSQSLQKTTVGRISYVYNPSSKNLNRIEQDFSQLYNDDQGKVSTSLTTIKFLLQH